MTISISGGVSLPGTLSFSKPPSPAPSGYALWAWGDGANGRLGLGNTTDYSSPVQVGASNDWAIIASGSYSGHAIKTDGTLWTWGAGSRIGDGTGIAKSSPVQIGAFNDWSKISSGPVHAFAIRADNTLWAWGRASNYGQLGDGTNVNKSSPVQIGSLTDWASTSNGGNHSLAVKTDGTLWAWGRGTKGQVGDNSTVTKSSPVQIGNLTDWAVVEAGDSSSHAIKTDGTLWGWGFNDRTQLGFSGSDKSSPVQVGVLTNWINVSAGGRHSHAINSDGKFFSWGNAGGNLHGLLGNGTKNGNVNHPTQIGNLTNWSVGYIGKYNTLVVKTDGSLWAWGKNEVGQLGDGTTNGRSSPVQIGSLTDWVSNKNGPNHTIALKSV